MNLSITADPWERNWQARSVTGAQEWALYDISDPGKPKSLSFLATDGVGVHRLWYVGGRWAYASVLPDGYTDYIFAVIDLEDPVHPRWAGTYHLPGMHTAAGEQPDWDAERWRYALHHAIVDGNTVYASWRDGGLSLIDLSDRDNPALITYRNWSPPFGGGTHTALPLTQRELLVVADEATADELADGMKHVWVFDIREKGTPVSISTFENTSRGRLCPSWWSLRSTQPSREPTVNLHLRHPNLCDLSECRGSGSRHHRRVPPAKSQLWYRPLPNTLSTPSARSAFGHPDC